MTDFVNTLTNDPTVSAVGLAILGAIAALWLAAAWWTYSDISRRSNSELARLLATGWVLASTPPMLPLSLGAYLLARPQQTVAERRAQRLFEAIAPSLEDGLCPACGATVDPAWHRCPTCATWLASGCESCGSWSPADVSVCPFCARDKGAFAGATPDVEADRALGAAGETALSGVDLSEDGASDGEIETQIDDAPGWRLDAPIAAVRTLRRTPGRAPAHRPVNRGARVRGAESADRSAGSTSVGIGS